MLVDDTLFSFGFIVDIKRLMKWNNYSIFSCFKYLCRGVVVLFIFFAFFMKLITPYFLFENFGENFLFSQNLISFFYKIRVLHKSFLHTILK